MPAPTISYLATANDTAAYGANAQLFKVNVSTAAASAVVTVYNGTATTDPVLDTIDASSKSTSHYEGARCPRGLFVKLTGGNAKVSVVAA